MQTYQKLAISRDPVVPGKNLIWVHSYMQKVFFANMFFCSPLSHVQPPAGLNATSSNFFKGCIELLSLNEELISLYNFEEKFQMNTTTDVPCSR